MILAVLNGFSSVTSVVRPSDAASRSTMGCTSLPARTIIGAASAAAISAASAASVMRAISPLTMRIVVEFEPLLVLCGRCGLLSLGRCGCAPFEVGVLDITCSRAPWRATASQWECGHGAFPRLHSAGLRPIVGALHRSRRTGNFLVEQPQRFRVEPP
jgi:hypothetical protein